MGRSWDERFEDRVDAGRQLGSLLDDRLAAASTAQRADIVVLGLPRGGVPVAAEVARALHAPLDVILVRKLGLPGHSELAMGAIGEGGAEVLNGSLATESRVTGAQLDDVRTREQQALDARAIRLRRGRKRRELTGVHAIVVDDGVATGATAAVACEVARLLGAARITLAVPVIPRELDAGTAKAIKVFGADVEIVALHAPRDFWAVGNFYADFSQTPDAEVEHLLDLYG